MEIQVLHPPDVEPQIFLELEILRVMPPARAARQVAERRALLQLPQPFLIDLREQRPRAESDARTAECAARSADRSAAEKVYRFCGRVSKLALWVNREVLVLQLLRDALRFFRLDLLGRRA